jgi:hypothetical protein
MSDLYSPSSNSCIFIPIENWTHVYMNFFSRNSPYYHLLKHLLFLLKHPVYQNDVCSTSSFYIWLLLLYCIEFYYQIFQTFQLTSNDASLLEKETLLKPYFYLPISKAGSNTNRTHVCFLLSLIRWTDKTAVCSLVTPCPVVTTGQFDSGRRKQPINTVPSVVQQIATTRLRLQQQLIVHFSSFVWKIVNWSWTFHHFKAQNLLFMWAQLECAKHVPTTIFLVWES